MTSIPQRILDLMLQSQYWPSADLQAFQRNQLGQLVNHAYANVPFYKNRLKPLFDHNGNINWKRWVDIPITKRTDLRDHSKAMLATELPPLHGPVKEFHTSGSSGVPISVTYGPIFSATAQAAKYRAFAWHGIDYAKTNARIALNDVAGTRLVEDYYIREWGPFWTASETHGREVVMNRTLSSHRKLQIMTDHAANYLSAFPNSMELLARVNLEQVAPIKLAYVIAYGQGTTAEQRELFASSFKAQCLQLYSSKEGGKIAYQCPHHDHFHVNSETVLLEILDEHDQPCPRGVRGRIVITPIFNSAQPLIRYDQGDIGMLGERCSCGRTLEVLQSIFGRQDPIWKFPDDTDISPTIDSAKVREAMQALAYQIAQVAPMALEVRYIPTSIEAKPNETIVRRHIAEIVRPDLEVRFVRLDALPTNSGGKTQLFTREIELDQKK